jgi:tetratricopeptide (TPR) repeat protein
MPEPDNDSALPLLFVAMPFGPKTEPGGARTIDFDDVYTRCIRPAADSAGVEVIRADEETLGGIIHKPMYERLLLAEIVIADLTFANANVFYELGVRHAARPRSTLLMYAKVGHLPFDVAPIRAIPYELDDAGAVVEPDALAATLATRLELAKSDEATDSPLFQLLKDYPGIRMPHDVTDAFRARAVRISALTVQAHEAARPYRDKDEARAELNAIERIARGFPEPEEQLLVTILLGYRDIEAWEDMVRLAESMPQHLKDAVTVREQYALALNRRNERGDRRRAIDAIEALIAEHGPSAETYGILGRCYKDQWREKARAGDVGAADALDRAIEAYDAGFEADPRDFYPGINLLTLLVQRNGPHDSRRINEVAPVVTFATARVGALRSNDYWTLATVLELAAIANDERQGRRALSAMEDTDPHDWMRTTTAGNLVILAESLARLEGREHQAWVHDVAARLRPA